MSDILAQLRELERRLDSRDDDIDAARKLIELLRPLAEQAPQEYQDRLAYAWVHYGASLAHADQAAALAGDTSTTREQRRTTEVQWLREISNDKDLDSLVQLVSVLQDLAGHQLEVAGRPELAESLLQETHHHLRRISGSREAGRTMTPQRWNVLLAQSSLLLAKCRLRLGDYRTAVQCGQEAEARLRRAGVRSEGLEPDLADTLQTLALALSHEHASKAELRQANKNISRAIGLYGRLKWEFKGADLRKEGIPDLFHEECARAQFLQAKILMAQRKKLRALAAYEAAADQFFKIAELTYGQAPPTDDEHYRPFLAGAVQAHEAAGAAEEAQRLRRRYGMPAATS